jgi:FdhD protein
MDRNRNIYQAYQLTRYEDGSMKSTMQDFVREEPLLISVEDRPYYIVMRTPGDEIPHAAGFCLSEGLVEFPQDIASIGLSNDIDENNVTVKLNEERKRLVSQKLESRLFLSQTSCRIYSKEMMEGLTNNLKVADETSQISYRQVIKCVEKFLQHQEYYTRTRGTHAVMLFDSRLNIIVKAEDVGRHNAMDKSIGALFLEDRMSDVYLAVLSSRISFEVMQKAARAGIPILISLSNPTSIAVDLGLKLNMTLVCLDKNSGFIVPCGEKRISASSPLGDELKPDIS